MFKLVVNYSKCLLLSVYTDIVWFFKTSGEEVDDIGFDPDQLNDLLIGLQSHRLQGDYERNVLTQGIMLQVHLYITQT